MKELRGKNFWVVLLLGFASFIFVGGSYNVDLMALLSPVFFLMITRKTTKAWDFVLIAVAMGIAGIIKYPKLIWSGFPDDQIVAFVLVSLTVFLYVIDHFVYKAFTKNANTSRKFAATFIFPIIFAMYEIFCNYTFIGSTFSMSVTQNDILPLMQFASIFGQYGLAFIVMWVPSFIYFLLDVIANMEEKSLKEFVNIAKKPIAIFTIVFLAIFTYGELRLCLQPVTNDYVRVAYSHGVKNHNDKMGQRVLDDLSILETALSNQMQIAARNEAKLLCFHEEAFYISSENLDTFTKYICKEAKANNLYTLVGIDCKSTEDEELSKNMAILVGPDGSVLSKYNKSKLIPFVETYDYQPGDSNIPVLPLQLSPNTESMVSTAICFEGEFSEYINQVGPATDIHLNPSFEWIDYSEFHNKALQLRAIEHGMSVIEPTVHNTSSIFDCLGNLIATSSTQTTGYDAVTFGDIPAEGVYTLYILGGYIVDYLYTPALIVFIILGIKRCRNIKKKELEQKND